MQSTCREIADESSAQLLDGVETASCRPPPPEAASDSKVLMSTDAVGGVWTYALELARGLSASGAQTHLAVLGPEPTPNQLDDAVAIRGLSVTMCRLPLDWTAQNEAQLDAVAAKLHELSEVLDADVVHLNAPAHAGLACWNRPLVITAHSCVSTWWSALHKAPMPPDLNWRAMRNLRGLLLADAVITPSHSFSSALRERYAFASGISVVYNGRSWLPAAVSKRNGKGALTAGRLWDPAKNLSVIDRAAQRT